MQISSKEKHDLFTIKCGIERQAYIERVQWESLPFYSKLYKAVYGLCQNLYYNCFVYYYDSDRYYSRKFLTQTKCDSSLGK